MHDRLNEPEIDSTTFLTESADKFEQTAPIGILPLIVDVEGIENEQQRVDEILDKIARSGYDSLTKEEKDFLFNYSKK